MQIFTELERITFFLTTVSQNFYSILCLALTPLGNKLFKTFLIATSPSPMSPNPAGLGGGGTTCGGTTAGAAGAAVERASQRGVSIFSMNFKYSVFLYLGHTVRPSGCVKLNSKSESLQNNKCFNYCSVPNVEQFILMCPSGHLRSFKREKTTFKS